MSIRYLCIDDAETGMISSFTEKVAEASGGQLQIEVSKPSQFAEIIAFVEGNLPDGLIIDLRLDETPFDDDGARAGYRGTTLAQELRTRMGEGIFPSIPIVLWSVDENFTASFKNIKSAHDIFDQVYVKDTAVAKNPDKVAHQLIDLSQGYAYISAAVKEDNLRNKILGLGEDEDWLDPRIGVDVDNDGDLPEHEYANYVLNSVVKPRGVLIEEEILAARLGVALESKDWPSLKDKLRSVQYVGAFSNAWSRWWATKLDDWWFELDLTPKSLRSLTASERVGLIQDKFGFENLQVAQPINESYSTKFWTICQLSMIPIDTADGYMINSPQHHPWIEPQYVSAEALLYPRGRRTVKLNPLERERFMEYRNQLKGKK